MKRLAPLAFLTLLSLCALLGSASGGDKGEPNQFDNPYYPLKKGTTWEYIANSKKVTVKVTDHEKIDNILCAKLETDSGSGAVMTEHLMVTDKGIYRVRAQGKKVEPPLLLLKFPPTKGEEWQVDSTAENFAIKGKMTVADDKEKVTVGKEEYTTFLVKSTDLKMGGQGATMECWYAKDRGLVKQHFKIPSAGLEITVELEKFTAGK